MVACSEEGYFERVYVGEVCLEGDHRSFRKVKSGDTIFSFILVGEVGTDFGFILGLLCPSSTTAFFFFARVFFLSLSF